MTPLSRLLALPQPEQERLGVVFTAREIAQQPATWAQTWKIVRDGQLELSRFLRRTLEHRHTVFLVGAGTSDYIGAAVAPLLRASWGCDVHVTPSTDLLTNSETMVRSDHEYLWISFSRSGESPEGVAVLESALQDRPNVRHLVVTCSAYGTMAQLAERSSLAHALVLDDVVNDRSLAMTSSFTNMTLAGLLLGKLKDLEATETILTSMQEAAISLLGNGSQLAEKLAAQEPERACFLGTAGLAATARESALKLLEMTAGGVPTASETILGLRHGPMAALNRKTLCAAYLSHGSPRRLYEDDLLAELGAKQTGSTLISIGRRHEAAEHSLLCEAFSEIPDAFRPPVDVIFGQLLGLFSSLRLGLKPDAPSPCGIINRVVQRFSIYR